MSRSRKKPWVKDRGMRTHEYWRPIRSQWKQHLKQNYLDEDLQFKNPKTIINDYDYCDYRWEIRERTYGYINWMCDWVDMSTTTEDVDKARRK